MTTSTRETPAIEGSTGRHRLVGRLREMALAALPRMYRPERRLFAFRLRRENGQDVLEGISRRYTAMVLIGLATESAAAAADILHGESPADVAGGLIGELGDMTDLGEVAMALWAANVVGAPAAETIVPRLASMLESGKSWPMVETSSALAALCAGGRAPLDARLAGRVAERLMRSFDPAAELFPHWPVGSAAPRLRRHVCCFADFVYPVQALSCYHKATGSQEALDIARRCANRMCGLQGPTGQWWWHFDARTGAVIEEYPVYAVHQHAMAPMAFHALRDAGGEDHDIAVNLGLDWLGHSPETGGSLIDEQAGVIWRKVARYEPGKLVRAAQALSSCVHPSLRVPGLGLVFRPGFVDYETRPYCMGWLLHAWQPTGGGES